MKKINIIILSLLILILSSFSVFAERTITYNNATASNNSLYNTDYLEIYFDLYSDVQSEFGFYSVINNVTGTTCDTVIVSWQDLFATKTVLCNITGLENQSIVEVYGTLTDSNGATTSDIRYFNYTNEVIIPEEPEGNIITGKYLYEDTLGTDSFLTVLMQVVIVLGFILSIFLLMNKK